MPSGALLRFDRELGGSLVAWAVPGPEYRVIALDGTRPTVETRFHVEPSERERTVTLELPAQAEPGTVTVRVEAPEDPELEVAVGAADPILGCRLASVDTSYDRVPASDGSARTVTFRLPPGRVRSNASESAGFNCGYAGPPSSRWTADVREFDLGPGEHRDVCLTLRRGGRVLVDVADRDAFQAALREYWRRSDHAGYVPSGGEVRVRLLPGDGDAPRIRDSSRRK